MAERRAQQPTTIKCESMESPKLSPKSEPAKYCQPTTPKADEPTKLDNMNRNMNKNISKKTRRGLGRKSSQVHCKRKVKFSVLGNKANGIISKSAN